MKRVLPVLLVAFVVFAYGAPLLRGQTVPQNPSSPITSVPGSVPVTAPGEKTQAAVAVTTVPSPASPNHVPEQVIWSLAMAYALQWVKNKGWLGANTTAQMKTMIGAAVAIATAAGIHIGVSGSLIDGNGALTVTGLSFNAFKDIGFQWVSQQAWYDGLVKKVVA